LNFCLENTRSSSCGDMGRGLSWETVVKITEKELSQLLFPLGSTKPAYKMPDYDYIHREMAKSGVTLTLLWLEYCDRCRDSGQVPYKSTQFNKYYADYAKNTKATMHIHRKPGEIMEVDWAGQTAGIIDTDTGEIIQAYVFVAALPYSGYAYVEAFLSRNQECWITAHVNAYRFFGGVTRIVVPDNLKTGVEKVKKEETVINKTYQEMAEHYGTAIIPARIRAPKDKPTVEGSVGIISTWILAALRNQQFLSLRELNAAIREKLMVFLEKPFQKKDGCRAVLFAEEKPFLLPLPTKPFELATWKIATVQYNYHISVDTQNYSVPFEYIKQKTDVRITRNVIEVFFQGNRICSHPRLYGKSNQYSTIEAHMPPDHQKYVAWNGDRFKSWAAKIGEHTSAVISSFLGRHKVEQQGYKACMALLRLTDKYSVERLESACTKALSYTEEPSLKGIQAILKSGQDKLLKETAPHSSSEFGLTRGADYYSRRNGKC
jgi:transposase